MSTLKTHQTWPGCQAADTSHKPSLVGRSIMPFTACFHGFCSLYSQMMRISAEPASETASYFSSKAT